MRLDNGGSERETAPKSVLLHPPGLMNR